MLNCLLKIYKGKNERPGALGREAGEEKVKETEKSVLRREEDFEGRDCTEKSFFLMQDDRDDLPHLCRNVH